MARFGWGLGLVAVALASVAQAQTVTGEAAQAMLFAPGKAEVELSGGDILPKDQAKVLQMVAVDQPYYAAIAISPDEGLMSEATVAAANYHTVEAASSVALAECNAKKQGAAACVVVALVRPEGWAAQPLQLSSDASAAMADYAGGAVAVSAATGSWGVGDTTDAAVAACVDRNPAATDCVAVIAD
jgi:hypothetical protein